MSVNFSSFHPKCSQPNHFNVGKNFQPQRSVSFAHKIDINGDPYTKQSHTCSSVFFNSIQTLYNRFQTSNTRIHVTELNNIPVIAFDQKCVKVGLVAKYRITDSRTAASIDNIHEAIKTISDLSIRRKLAEYPSQLIIHDQELLGSDILQKLGPVLKRWGVEMDFIEIKEAFLDAKKSQSVPKKSDAEKYLEKMRIIPDTPAI
jgi:regulator of protease activity HflC (stomatin/prohibitin superfamily)